MSLCLLSGGALKALQVTAFTLVWTHSVEKVDWQEDWRVGDAGLQLVEARVKGSGAGMEPPPEARLSDGWWRWSPQRTVTDVVLGNSGAAGEWRICAAGGGTCQPLSMIFGWPLTGTITMTRCERR